MERAVASRGASTMASRLIAMRALEEKRCFCGARPIEVRINHVTGQVTPRCSEHSSKNATSTATADRRRQLDLVELDIARTRRLAKATW